MTMVAGREKAEKAELEQVQIILTVPVGAFIEKVRKVEYFANTKLSQSADVRRWVAAGLLNMGDGRNIPYSQVKKVSLLRKRDALAMTRRRSSTQPLRWQPYQPVYNPHTAVYEQRARHNRWRMVVILFLLGVIGVSVGILLARVLP